VGTAVQQIKQGKEIVQSISRSVNTISSLATAASRDNHIYPLEFTYMTSDLDKIAKVGTDILADMKTGLAGSGNVLKMSDGERANWIREVHKRVLAYEQGIQIYFKNIQSRSYSRTLNQADVRNTSALYRLVADASQNAMFNYNATITGTGYDGTYDNTDKPLDTKASEAEKELRNFCQLAYQNYYDEVQIAEMNNEKTALRTLMAQGYQFQAKDPKWWQGPIINTVTMAGDLNDFTTTMTTSGSELNLEDTFKGFIRPNGQKISNEEMMMEIRIESRKTMGPIQAAIKTKHGLDKCDGLN
jgi:hypothetical protein